MNTKIIMFFKRFRLPILITGTSLLGLFTWLFFLMTFSEGQKIELLEQKIRIFLFDKLNMPYHSHPTPESVNQDKRKVVIYVMGGDQHSLRVKYATTACLYNTRIGKKVMILHMPGITEYDEVLDRNLTNDEWSLKQLTSLGLASEDIEFISVPNLYFGTFSEARELTDIITKRGIKRLYLVSSSYHAKRVWITFSALLRNTGVVVEIYSADEKVGLRGLLKEYSKMVFYENLLVPLYVRVF
jgi:hypothetical protein